MTAPNAPAVSASHALTGSGLIDVSGPLGLRFTLAGAAIAFLTRDQQPLPSYRDLGWFSLVDKNGYAGARRAIEHPKHTVYPIEPYTAQVGLWLPPTVTGTLDELTTPAPLGVATTWKIGVPQEVLFTGTNTSGENWVYASGYRLVVYFNPGGTEANYRDGQAPNVAPTTVAGSGARTIFSTTTPNGNAFSYQVVVNPPTAAGSYSLNLGVVQEGNHWTNYLKGYAVTVTA